MFEFSGRVALVTGAVSGIGLGIARALLDEGMTVCLGYRKGADFEAASAVLGHPAGDRIAGVQLDITRPEQWAAAVADLTERFGGLDLLVNNAGTSFVGSVDQATQADWDWILGVNLFGAIHGVNACLPAMRLRSGAAYIVNVSSMAAYLPAGEVGLYSTSKFALRGYTAALRATLFPEGVGVSELAPGLTRSNIHLAAGKRPAEFADTRLSQDPAITEAFASLMDAGMDPVEVGRKTVAGIQDNRPVIFTHPEFRDEIAEDNDLLAAAFPDEPVPPARQAIEDRRRAGKRSGGQLATPRPSREAD